MSNLESIITPHLDALQAAITEFEAQQAEYQKGEESIGRYESFRDEARQSADEKNLLLRELIRKDAPTKDVLKCQAARNGCLEDGENFQAIADDQRRVQKGKALDLSRLANKVISHNRITRVAAIDYLKMAVVEKLGKEFFMLYELLREEAAAGASSHFNADPTSGDASKFAAQEIAALVSIHLVQNRRQGTGVSSLIPEVPADINRFMLSPIKIQMLERELAGDSK